MGADLHGQQSPVYFIAYILIVWYGVACWQCRFLFLKLLGLASRCSSLPTFYGTFLHQAFISIFTFTCTYTGPDLQGQ